MRRADPLSILSILLACVLIAGGCEDRRDPGTEGVPQPPPGSRKAAPPGAAEEDRRPGAPPKPTADEPGATSPTSPRADSRPDSIPPRRPGEPASDGAPPHAGPSCDAIYTITTGRRLYAFDPRTNRFALRGTIDCPDVTDASPFSMAVARTGVAHVLFDDGGIREIDLNDARCAATSFRRNQLPAFERFGMSYARHGGRDALFVIAIPNAGRSALARVSTFPGPLEKLGTITVEGRPSLIELSGSPDGLWGFLTYNDRSSRLAKIDRKTGRLQRSAPVDVGRHADGLALAWFGGAFYIFTHVRKTTVTRYDPAARTTSVVATLGDRVVGAGASTCVPTS